MAFSVETVRRLMASGRNYVSSAAGFLLGIGLMSAAQSKDLTDAVNDIVTGVNQVITGSTKLWQVGVAVFAPIISIIAARWASNSATAKSQAAGAAAVANDKSDPAKAKEAQAAILTATTSIPDVKVEGVIRAPAEVAAAVPSNAVQPGA